MQDVGEDNEGEDEERGGVGWYEEEGEPAVMELLVIYFS